MNLRRCFQFGSIFRSLSTFTSLKIQFIKLLKLENFKNQVQIDVRGQNHYSERTLWHFKSTFGSSQSVSSAYQNFVQGVHEILSAVSISTIPVCNLKWSLGLKDAQFGGDCILDYNWQYLWGFHLNINSLCILIFKLFQSCKLMPWPAFNRVSTLV